MLICQPCVIPAECGVRGEGSGGVFIFHFITQLGTGKLSMGRCEDRDW